MFESDFLTPGAKSRESFRDVISQAAQIVAESLLTKPYCGKNPSALSDLIDCDFLPAAASPDRIAEILRTVVSNSVAVGHPNTIAHLHCPPLLASLAAEVVISALNQSMDSFDQAPIATLVEQKIVRWLCSEVGLPAAAEGTFTTGGSQSNYMDLLLARNLAVEKHWTRNAQQSGLPADASRLRILCSEAAHFTVEKSMAQLGMGSDSVVRVEVDHHFRMLPGALSRALDGLRRQNLLPMAVVATAGTTDFGSIDPLPELASIARSAGTWLHVDAAYGGALLFSGKHRTRLAGLESADSLSIDFHKLFWQPIPCSVFLVRDAGSFDSIKMHADYLNPEFHDEEGIPNLVTTSLLTSRRCDALKLWISFQALGRGKLAAMIDRTIDLANHAAKKIRQTPQLELVAESQLSTVVFRFVPSQKTIDADALNAKIRQRLFDQGTAVIGHTRVRNRQCLKVTCMNPACTNADLDTLIVSVAAAGKDLEAEISQP